MKVQLLGTTHYRMTRVTFEVSASSLAANMAIYQNALDQSSKYPLAAKVVEDSITGAYSIEEAILLHKQLQAMFHHGGFPLRKWNSSSPDVLRSIDPLLTDVSKSIALSDSDSCTKALGIEWDVTHDNFHLTMNEMTWSNQLTKRMLVSNIAKLPDVLGWVSPIVITMKILLQCLRELKIDWDEHVPPAIIETWEERESELDQLATRL